jgi:mycothiol synthase
MRRPTLENLPALPPVPAGYLLRRGELSDEPALLALLSAAFEVAWTLDRVRRDVTRHDRVDATYVVAHDGLVVATASAMSLEGGRSGNVHYVATHPDHRGKGLGRVVTVRVLQHLAMLRLEDAFLLTDDFRLPALRLYLRLGFVPRYQDQTHEGRWSLLFPQLVS